MIQAIIHAEADWTGSDYILAPDVIFLLIQDGSARLLDLRGNSYALSQIGTKMLHRSLKGDVTTAASSIAIEYHTELALVQNDLRTFLLDLEKKKLIYPKNKYYSRSGHKKVRLTSLLLIPLLHFIYIFPVSLERRIWALLALTFLSIKVFGWPDTIALWYRYQQKRTSRRVPPELEQYVKCLDKTIRIVAANHPFHVECKERALSCWGLLRSAGFSAKLVIGIYLFPLEGHCWCEAEQCVLGDDQDRCEQFTPILSYE